MRHLFPDSFLASIGGLKLDVRPAPPRAAHGVHLSPAVGASTEFRDFQSYTPGDDLRRVDWNVYARTKHLFVRRFDHPTAVPIVLLVDASASMRLETPDRYATAARAAAAVASAGLGSMNGVQCVVADGGPVALPRAGTGRRGLARVLADLAADRPPGGPGITASIDSLLPALAGKGRGVLVIVSDFFEQNGVDALLATLRGVTQRLVLIRITQPWDAEPDLTGELELTDCESGAKLGVSVNDDILARYRQAYQAYFGELDAFARLRGAAQYVVDASAETLPQLSALFPGGVLAI